MEDRQAAAPPVPPKPVSLLAAKSPPPVPPKPHLTPADPPPGPADAPAPAPSEDASGPPGNPIALFGEFLNNDGPVASIVGAFDAYRTAARAAVSSDGLASRVEELTKDDALPRGFAELLVATAPGSYSAKALFDTLEANFRDAHAIKRAPDAVVLCVGAGPSGLRAAIEACFLRCRQVKVVEKRATFTRHNVLHLWPWTMADLKKIGLKHVFAKFGVGGIEHIAIRRLQLALLKLALLVGAEVHPEVSFEWPAAAPEPGAEPGHEDSKPPAMLDPKFSDPSLDPYPCNVLLCCTGEHSKLTAALGFGRAGFRPTQAIGITCNFSREDPRVELACKKIQKKGGYVSYLNKQWFGEIEREHGVALENLVYYQDETHYLVMCIREANLLRQGVLREDFSTMDKILAPSNVDPAKLEECVRKVALAVGIPEEAKFMTGVDGKSNDVAIFDFSEKSNATEPSKLVRYNDRIVLACPLGDSLLEPFWPLGTGCAHACLSALDAMWIVGDRLQPLLKAHAAGADPASLAKAEEQLLADHAALFRALKASTADTVPSDASVGIDPRTRYVGKVGEAMAAGGRQSYIDMFERDMGGKVPREAATEPVDVVESSEGSGTENEEGEREAKRAKT
ncbi:hypothetical protein DFJ74DRAFT_762909, partial [Hyaloraphidium curvatum]